MHSFFLVPHIIAGSVGLLLGPLAMLMPKTSRWHPRLGTAYQITVAVLALSAVGLVVLAPARLWVLGLIAVATEAAAVAGLLLRRRGAPGWLPAHVRLMCGSYLSFLTAFLVVNWSSPLAWVLPTLIGTPLIAQAAGRAAGRTTDRQPATV